MDYYFSGGLTKGMVGYLTALPGFEPIDVLVSQLDRSSIKDIIMHQANGVVNKLFIDSGAFSVHTGKAKVDLDEYISYVNSIDEHIHVVAQLDTIPGTFGQPKSSEDYKQSAKLSWENFLYMYSKLKSPEKLIPVFHYGESFDSLKHMLDWRDGNDRPLTYLGVSPANDTSQNIKNIYMKEVYDFIAKSSNPEVKTHLFGMTSLDALSKVPAYSADSVSHRLIGAYNKIYHPEFGVISLSKRSRTSNNKSGRSFIDTCDDVSLEKLTSYLANLHISLENVQEDHSARCVVCMYGIIQHLKAHPYKPANLVRAKRLFDLPAK